MIGGKVIAAGGFGCVFRPTLKCKNKSKKYNGVSKLLVKENATEEYQEILDIKPILKKITNSNNYFIADDIEYCTPDKLNDDDFENFNKCKHCLIDRGFDKNNINYNLDKLGLLQIPDGGKDIDHVIALNIKFEDLKSINNALISLLVNGIIKMNEYKLYHFDIKASNIMYKNGKAKLIDWGLACIQKKDEIPECATRRPFQYNAPFSNILFDKNFPEWYHLQLKNHKKYNSIAYDWINIKKGGHSHFDLHKDYINSIKNDLFQIHLSKKILINADENNYYMNVIINYLVNIFKKFTDTKNKMFMSNKYFNDVFSKNIDIWGFLSTYIPFMLYSDNFEFVQKISNIINKYLYGGHYAAIPIDTKKLVNDLRNLNVSFSKYKGDAFDNKTISKKMSEFTAKTKSMIIGDSNIDLIIYSKKKNKKMKKHKTKKNPKKKKKKGKKQKKSKKKKKRK